MNLKLNNEVRNCAERKIHQKADLKALSIKEERQRTGRFIAILVGILLFLLAIYHAWVRRIPFVASLVVPAIIMFVYVGWVLFTASRDKQRALYAEAAQQAALAEEAEANTIDNACCASFISIENNKPGAEATIVKDITEVSSVIVKGSAKLNTDLVKPIILVNDEPPCDIDQVLTEIVIEDTTLSIGKFKYLPARRKFKRKFCRSKRNAVFKRSYSIA